jgi:hypothetical protein
MKNPFSVLPTLCLLCGGLGSVAPLHAQRFSAYPAGDDSASSLGEFRLVVDAAWVDVMDAALAGSVLATTETWPGSGMLIYDGGVFTSPVLFDAATVIGRSDPFVSDAPQDALGMLAGRAPGRTYVGDSMLTVRPPWLDATGRVYEIHTYLKSLNLSDAVTTRLGITVKGGMDAPTRPVCAGEVEAYTTNSDFPARSFFNVYVKVDLPASGALPAVQLVNVNPLLVVNSAIYSIPPHVFYIHGNTNAVPVYFNTPISISNPNGTVTIPRGTLFGQLTLGGHGMSYAEYEIPSFEAEMEAEIATGTMPTSPNPSNSVVVQDFSPNYYAVPVPGISQSQLTNGTFSFTVTNVTSTRTAYVQRCTNLFGPNWVTIRTNVPTTNYFLFSDSAAGNGPQQYYRVIATP